MDTYCQGCRFLVIEGAVCYCLKGWPERPCQEREPETPTKGEIPRAVDEGLIPMVPGRKEGAAPHRPDCFTHTKLRLADECRECEHRVNCLITAVIYGCTVRKEEE